MNKPLLNHKEIIKGLEFYDIKDDIYLKKCLKCCDFILNNHELKYKFETIYTTLYNNPKSSLRSIWKQKRKEELFGDNYYPFTTNLMLLLGYSVHQRNIQSHKLDSYQIEKQKLRVKQALTNDIYKRNLDDIRISQMLWGVYLINIKIIEIGRLQYEHYKDCENEYIKVHIPAGEKLIYENVLESFKESKKYIKNYFYIDCSDYYCNSWLLSKQINKLSSADSNINKFQDFFEIQEGDDCLKDILNFVYQKNNVTDFNSLDERTSLQKNIKNYLSEGNKIKIGIGKLKKSYLQ